MDEVLCLRFGPHAHVNPFVLYPSPPPLNHINTQKHIYDDMQYAYESNIGKVLHIPVPHMVCIIEWSDA